MRSLQVVVRGVLGQYPAESALLPPPSRSWTPRRGRRMLAVVDESEPGWRAGDTIYVDLPDGQTVRCEC